MPESEQDVVACAEAGVAGYVTRDASIDDLVATIDSVVRGEALLSPTVGATLLRGVAAPAVGDRHDIGERLTAREWEVLDLVGEGLSNKQIAKRLEIETPTVKNHVHNILEKLDAHSRTEAAARARGVRYGRRAVGGSARA